MKNYFLLPLLFLCIWSCSTDQTESNEEKQTITTIQHFGEKISIDNAISYDAMLTDLSSKDSVEAKVKGKVSGVCQAKGCWMTIVSEEAGKPEMFVKFKDYGFFMPLDLAGSEVIMAGKAYREETSVDELRHYAEDEGQSAEEIAKITEPAEELKFLAYGVVVLEN
jgi:hypothetical protein